MKLKCVMIFFFQNKKKLKFVLIFWSVCDDIDRYRKVLRTFVTDISGHGELVRPVSFIINLWFPYRVLSPALLVT